MAKHLKPWDYLDVHVSVNTLEAIIYSLHKQAEKSCGAGREYYFDLAEMMQEKLDEKDKPAEIKE